MKLSKNHHKNHLSILISGLFIMGLFSILILPTALATNVFANTDSSVNQPFTGFNVDITINGNTTGELTISSLTNAPDSPGGKTVIGIPFNVTFTPDNSSETLNINSANITITPTLELIVDIGGLNFDTIQIYYYNLASGDWIPLVTALVNNSFVANITSLGYFGLFTETLGVDLNTITIVTILVTVGVLLSLSPALMQSRRQETPPKAIGKTKSTEKHS